MLTSYDQECGPLSDSLLLPRLDDRLHFALEPRPQVEDAQRRVLILGLRDGELAVGRGRERVPELRRRPR